MNTLAARASRADVDTTRRRRSLWTPLLALVLSAGGALAVLALGLLLLR